MPRLGADLPNTPLSRFARASLALQAGSKVVKFDFKAKSRVATTAPANSAATWIRHRGLGFEAEDAGGPNTRSFRSARAS